MLRGGVNESILSVDSFRALDTTRIFAAKVRSPLALENKVVESLPGKFVLNRIAGGDAKLIGFANALGADIVKKHQLKADPTPELDCLCRGPSTVQLVEESAANQALRETLTALIDRIPRANQTSNPSVPARRDDRGAVHGQRNPLLLDPAFPRPGRVHQIEVERALVAGEVRHRTRLPHC